MELLIAEKWENDLWDEIERKLRERGGKLAANGEDAGTLGGILGRKGYAKKVKKKYENFFNFLEGCDPSRFVISGGSQKYISIVGFESDSNNLSKDMRYLSKGNAAFDSDKGVIVEVTRKGFFIRSNSQGVNCAKLDLYFASLTHLVDKGMRSLVRPGAAVAFRRTQIPPNPNPYCTDVAVLSGDSRRTDGTTHKGSEALNNNNNNSSNNNNKSFHLVSDENECKFACSLLLKCKMIALDCEGVNLGRADGSLCLIQVASSAGVFLFDGMKDNFGSFMKAGLRELLESSSIIKAIHDCKMDACALYMICGVRMGGVFDTQLAFSILYSIPRNVSLQDLVQKLTGKTHPLKKAAPHKTNQRFWADRPLTQEALLYASADVELLLEAALQMNKLGLSEKSLQDVWQRTGARISDAIASLSLDQTSRSEQKNGGAENIFERFANVEAKMSTDQRCKIEVDNEYWPLVESLPEGIAELLLFHLPDGESKLVDIVLDLHRPVTFIATTERPIRIEMRTVSEMDLEHVIEQCGSISDANRACVGNTLHRCSVIREPGSNDVIGVTIRMARIVSGLASTIKDVLGAGKSVLLVGPPGRGKTTLLRDIARMLASEEFGKRVMIVDTNNEIAGEGISPHRAIGHARRMKVGERSQQYQRMLEAVQNHTPETLVIDEIGTAKEVKEAIGVQQRGVQLIATTHGRSLADVIQNPHLRDLLGGVNTVILSASEKVNEQAPSKTRNERRMNPAFDVCIELIGLHKWRLHYDVAGAVDVVLRQLGEVVDCEVRELHPETGIIKITHEAFPDRETRVTGFQIDEDVRSDLE